MEEEKINKKENNNKEIKLKLIPLIVFIGAIVVISIAIIVIIIVNINKQEVNNRNTNSRAQIPQGYGGLSIPFGADAKPIIYLYPSTQQKISVKLENIKDVTCVYPKYDNGWELFAEPNGNLIDLKTGRSQYALYWERKNCNITNMNEGFCIKGEDISGFLEEKLKVLGLTEREANEFIIYWLPKLENNKYNLIRFATMKEINEYMPLNINPKPDTLIRVLMEYKGVDSYVEIPEQKLKTPERKGFVAVEWGGTEIK